MICLLNNLLVGHLVGSDLFSALIVLLSALIIAVSMHFAARSGVA